MKNNSWRFADSQANSLLGSDPMQHFKDAVMVKSNPVREVWRTEEFFFKFDKRSSHSFAKEFSRACALHKKGIPVVRKEYPYKKAIELGAYGVFNAQSDEQTVSVYEIDGVDLQICGGPHVANTGDLGTFKIKKEESSSSGVRRIKAVLN